MARPSVFNDEIDDKILADIASGKTTKETALRHGIKPITLAQRVLRGRKATRGKDFAFAQRFDAAEAEAAAIWEERVKDGDIETRTKYDKDGNEVERIEIARQKAADAWRWLERRMPEKYGPLEYDVEAFLKIFERDYGTQWAYLLQKVIDAAKESR